MRLAVALAGTDHGRSGIGVYIRAVLPRLADKLSARGDSLLVFGSGPDVDAYRDLLDGAEVTRLPDVLDRPAASALFHLALAGVVARRGRADVLLLPAANRRLTLRSPVPTVAVVHDLAQLHVPDKYDPARQAYFKYLVSSAFGSADRLVAVSGATRADLAPLVDGKAVDVVPNGVDVERFPPMPLDDPRVIAARRATGLADQDYVLYTSRLEHPGKNHLRLVRAFARSDAGHRFVLALAGKDWGAEALIREEARRFGVEERIRLLGFVGDDHLPGLVAGAAAVCMVGLREGFGLPALEALSAGRPVVASSTGALPEVVGDLGVMCDPMDEASIRAALDRALLDENLRARAWNEGPPWAARHGWDRTADGLLRVCDGVVRGG